MVNRLSLATIAVAFSATLASAQGHADIQAQKVAMEKLAFLVGRWSGEASVQTGPGEPRRLQQTEDVQFKLDGLVLLIEGTGRNPATGVVEFNALATIAYDEATKTYRFRAYNNGRYLDTPLEVRDHGFVWGYTAGPAKVTNAMRLDDAGRWVEDTDIVLEGGPPRRTVEIRVSK